MVRGTRSGEERKSGQGRGVREGLKEKICEVMQLRKGDMGKNRKDRAIAGVGNLQLGTESGGGSVLVLAPKTIYHPAGEGDGSEGKIARR